MAFTPSSERIASIFDERPYLARWARATSAACWRVIPVIGIVPPTSLPATFVIRQPDRVSIAATPSNIAAMGRFMLALHLLRYGLSRDGLYYGWSWGCRQPRNGCGRTRAERRQKEDSVPILTESTRSVSQRRHIPVRAPADTGVRL